MCALPVCWKPSVCHPPPWWWKSGDPAKESPHQHQHKGKHTTWELPEHPADALWGLGSVMFTMCWVRKYSWDRLSHWLRSSQLSSISSLGAKMAWVTLPEHTAFWENSGRGSLGLNTNTENGGKKNSNVYLLYICPGRNKSISKLCLWFTQNEWKLKVKTHSRCIHPARRRPPCSQRRGPPAAGWRP